MTPLQKAAQELLELHLPTYLDTHVSQLRKALADEQAQAVEPDTGERAAFESWYAKHTTESGFTMEASEVEELREGDQYGAHRVALNGKWEGWQAKAQQVAVPMTHEQISDLMYLTDGKWSDADVPMHWGRHFARAIEAHHKITAKPSHTDWSAA